MSVTQTVQTNVVQPQFITMQLAFSTADVEKGIFHTAEHAPIGANEPTGEVTLLVVHGDLFILEESAPQQSTPFTEEAGLFQIIGLDQQA